MNGFQEPDPHAYDVQCATECGRKAETSYCGKPWCASAFCGLEIATGLLAEAEADKRRMDYLDTFPVMFLRRLLARQAFGVSISMRAEIDQQIELLKIGRAG